MKKELGLDLQLLLRRKSDKSDLSVLLVSDQQALHRLLLERLKSELIESSELLKAVPYESAHQLLASIQPEIVIIDATHGRWPEANFCERIGYRAALIYVVDEPAAALAAFDAGAIDCLSTPIRRERLMRALQRAHQWLAVNHSHTASSPSPIAGSQYAQRMRIRCNGELLVIHLADVVYLRAERKLTRVIFKQGEGYLNSGISAAAGMLAPSQFWRIHRSLIVNADHVSAITQDEIGRCIIHLRERTETLCASQVHERDLLRDGIF